MLLVICVSLFIKKGEQEVVPIAIQTILPGSHKATLLMENGKEIELSDSVRMSIEQGIIVSNNQLKYGDSIKELASGYYHVLKIPRGGRILFETFRRNCSIFGILIVNFVIR